MPPPLDAEPSTAAPSARPETLARPRPTPFPRASAEAVAPPSAVAEPGDEVAEELAGLVDAGALPELPTTDVWGLVRRAQDGDAEAFGELYDHYVTLVHRYAYNRVGDRATAEDVTSETFVRALRRIDSTSAPGW
jgi:hypothetical protein